MIQISRIIFLILRNVLNFIFLKSLKIHFPGLTRGLVMIQITTQFGTATLRKFFLFFTVCEEGGGALLE